MRRSTTYLSILGLAVIAMLASLAVGVSAQNSNSSTTANTNTAKPKKPRRHKPKAPPAEATDAAAASADATPAPKRTGRCDPSQQEQTDLSGTYTGKLKHGDDPVQDATLTITGNNFTGTMGAQTVSGRVVAVTTCGYTAVTMMHEGQPRAMSLRAKRMGNGLTLTSVPGEPEKVMFTTGGGATRARKHRSSKPKKTEGAAATPKTTP